jgi:hypothetical protein
MKIKTMEFNWIDDAIARHRRSSTYKERDLVRNPRSTERKRKKKDVD